MTCWQASPAPRFITCASVMQVLGLMTITDGILGAVANRHDLSSYLKNCGSPEFATAIYTLSMPHIKLVNKLMELDYTRQQACGCQRMMRL